MLFGPTARHLSFPSRHGVRGHGGGSYIYDLVKRITNEKEKKNIKGAQTTSCLGPLLIIFPLRPDMVSVVMVVAAISMTY